MNILFIGNSYTFFNDMPKIFENLALANGKDVTVDSVTKGGRKLYSNLKDGDEYNTEIKRLISQKSYDVLILQEQSYFALVDYDKFEEGIKGLIELVNPERTVLYSTWGRKEGCPLLDELGLTSEEMTEKLSSAYLKAAKNANADVSPVGKGFLSAMKLDETLELYKPDLSHPSYMGSALAAIVHYSTVFGEMPKSYLTLDLDTDVLGKLIMAAEEIL